MIDYLYGNVSSTREDYVVIDVGGVGYGIIMATGAVRKISGGTAAVRIYTHLAVREDALVLYGFLETKERELFRLLMTVNRVGPQLAISILSQIEAVDLARAISAGDEKRLTRLSGVGPRNAKRIILELKEKVESIFPPAGTEGGVITGEVYDESARALINLGFSSKEAYDAVNRAASGSARTDTPSLIKTALGLLKEKKKS